MQQTELAELETGRAPYQRFVRRRAELVTEHLIEIVLDDSSAGKCCAKLALAHERLGAVDLGRGGECTLEWKILERMQCVVMDENPDRSLSRQELRGVLERA